MSCKRLEKLIFVTEFFKADCMQNLSLLYCAHEIITGAEYETGTRQHSS